jgi:hypothetical protein
MATDLLVCRKYCMSFEGLTGRFCNPWKPQASSNVSFAAGDGATNSSLQRKELPKRIDRLGMTSSVGAILSYCVQQWAKDTTWNSSTFKCARLNTANYVTLRTRGVQCPSHLCTAFWDARPCSRVQVHRRFGDTSCIHIHNLTASKNSNQQVQARPDGLFLADHSPILKMEAVPASETSVDS